MLKKFALRGGALAYGSALDKKAPAASEEADEEREKQLEKKVMKKSER